MIKMREENNGKGVMHARDFNCTRCMSAGKHTPAVVFVGLNDPDGTQYPMCRIHANEWHMDVLLGIGKLREDQMKMREPESS